MDNLLISVILPTYNDGKEAFKAVETVLSQEHHERINFELEIIMIDDASDEGKFKEVEEIANNYKIIKLIRSEKNRGPAVARNLGLKEAKGNLITFIDADDLWPTDKLKLLLPFIIDKDYSVAGGKVKYLMEEGRELDIEEWDDDDNRLTSVHLGALLVKRELFDNGLYFDNDLRFSEDVDWWLRIREQKERIIIVEDTTLFYRVHDSNMTKDATIKDFNILKVMHKSLKRRKEKGNTSVIPQIRDFRSFRDEPLISVIIPLFNGGKVVDKAIHSIKNQTYSNIEIIVIDDGSEDDGAQMIIEKHPDITVITREHGGAAKARNSGISNSNGYLVAFIDQDDEWLPEKLEQQWKELKNDPYCAWVTCNEESHKASVFSTADDAKKDIQGRSYFTSALLIRKHTILSMKGFNYTLKFGSELDLIDRLLKGGHPNANVDKVLLKKYVSPEENNPEYKKINDALLESIKSQLEREK